ncbi:hypothetical protein H4Q26_013714 [Puccinia striiformis f. sp. tritici PST-130]|nr:hypothetical protein H4Q26_013714 [Puccinia striiformis f. sp. tritici PST-130]
MDPRKPYSLFAGFIHLAAGLSCGMTGLAAGHAIGLIGDACARAFLFQSQVIGLYGLIIALILNTKAFQVIFHSYCILSQQQKKQV